MFDLKKLKYIRKIFLIYGIKKKESIKQVFDEQNMDLYDENKKESPKHIDLISLLTELEYKYVKAFIKIYRRIVKSEITLDSQNIMDQFIIKLFKLEREEKEIEKEVKKKVEKELEKKEDKLKDKLEEKEVEKDEESLKRKREEEEVTVQKKRITVEIEINEPIWCDENGDPVSDPEETEETEETNIETIKSDNEEQIFSP